MRGVIVKRARSRRGPIDWSQIRARLDEAQTRATMSTEVSPARSRAIMEERARKLAQVPDVLEVGETYEVLAFGLGPERYCIETRYTREVVRFVDYAPIPGTPDFVVGVTNLRGEVVCIIDLRKFFGTSQRGLTDLSRVIALGTETTEFGIVADQVFQVSALRAKDILHPPESTEVGHEYLLGVTREAAIILDGAALLRDPKLIIEYDEARDRMTRE
jgi:purine-binding chemotaxis protein CheW